MCFVIKSFFHDFREGEKAEGELLRLLSEPEGRHLIDLCCLIAFTVNLFRVVAL